MSQDSQVSSTAGYSSKESDYKNLLLEVYIRSRTKNYYKGSAQSLTTYNDKGELDILPMHTNFVSIIKKYIIVDKGLPTLKKFDLESAVLSVQDGKVDVYVGV
jgi:F0F1-type ATP synthase epsilon subunit